MIQLITQNLRASKTGDKAEDKESKLARQTKERDSCDIRITFRGIGIFDK